jgi:hypothetical protein
MRQRLTALQREASELEQRVRASETCLAELEMNASPDLALAGGSSPRSMSNLLE